MTQMFVAFYSTWHSSQVKLAGWAFCQAPRLPPSPKSDRNGSISIASVHCVRHKTGSQEHPAAVFGLAKRHNSFLLACHGLFPIEFHSANRLFFVSPVSFYCRGDFKSLQKASAQLSASIVVFLTKQRDQPQSTWLWLSKKISFRSYSNWCWSMSCSEKRFIQGEEEEWIVEAASSQ